MREEYSFIPNFRFMLRVDGAFNVPLKSVQAFTRENEYEYIQEGGMNDYVYMRRKPISKPYTLRVERYITTDFNDPLSNGTELLLPLLLFVGKNTGGGMDFARYYAFTGAVVMSKEYGALDAERGGLLTETMTIGYNQMFCITNPDDSTDKPEWSIEGEDGSDVETGNTKRLYSTSPAEPFQNSMKKKSFIRAANKWDFSAKSKEGNKKGSHVSIDMESTKAEMIDKRRHFNFAATANPLAVSDTTSKKSAQNAVYSDKSLGDELGIKELSKKEMSAKAKKFEFKDGKYMGNGVIASPHTIEPNKDEKRDFVNHANLWEFDGLTKAGTGESSRVSPRAPEISKDEMAKAARHGKTNRKDDGQGVADFLMS